MAASEPNAVPVAIVGGGPVGLMLALFLDRHGIRSVVFNVETTVRWHPKGSSHNSRTMEHYRRLGIVERVRKLGLPPDYPKDVTYLTRLNGRELTRFRMPSDAEAMRVVGASSRTDQIPEPIHRANQMYVEKLLLEHAGTRKNITLRFGWRVEDFAEDSAGVSLTAAGAGGARERWRADYLIGCDGGRSFVRERLGIRYQGHESLEQATFGGRMISAYVRAPTVYRDYLGTKRAWQHWVINPEVRTQIIALNGVDEFLMLSKLPPGSTELPDTPAIARMMQRSIGADAPVEVLSAGPWTAGAALVADSYGTSPVLMAGDAVHLFTPTGGFGMNTGIDDTANLSWKLAAVLQGWGGPKLLDTYEAERRPIGFRNTSVARAITRHVGGIDVPPVIEDDTPAGAAARRDTGSYIATYVQAEFASIGVELGARYDGSAIVIGDGPSPTDTITQYIPSSVPGGRTPHVWLGEGRGAGDSLFDRLGVGFTLLRLGPKPPDAAAFVKAAKARGIPFAIVDVPGDAARDLYGRDLALVRPDQHVAWRGNAVPEDVDAVLARVTGF